MNATERMKAAINLKPVDRVPNAPFYEAPICIFDNINPNGSLLIGKPKEVATETRAHLEKAKGMSGYIFSTSGTTSPATPRENFEAMNREVVNFKWS